MLEGGDKTFQVTPFDDIKNKVNFALFYISGFLGEFLWKLFGGLLMEYLEDFFREISSGIFRGICRGFIREICWEFLGECL